MAYCNSCGKELRENTSFCPSCSLPRSALTGKQVLKWGAIGFGGLVAAAIIFGGCLLILKGSESYQLATQYASENELIKAEIGEVTGLGLFPLSGSWSSHTSASGQQTTGQAAWVLKVHGDKGNGELHINLVNSGGGNWQIVQAIFVTDAGKQIETTR